MEKFLWRGIKATASEGVKLGFKMEKK